MKLVAGSLLVAATFVTPAIARGAPAQPVPVDLAKAPVGAWSEYHVTDGSNPPTVFERHALVGRSGGAVELQTETWAPTLPNKVIKRVCTVPIGANKPRACVNQDSDAAPTEVPADRLKSGRDWYTKPDATKLVGVETVVVPAGSFRAEHYRDTTSGGQQFDYWVSKEVFPEGLLKVVEGPMPGFPTSASTTMELTNRGTTGAKRAIAPAPAKRGKR